LLDRPELDSTVSVAPLERWAPGLTRRQTPDGLLEPFLPAAGKSAVAAAWHPTWGVTVIRPEILGSLPGEGAWPWLGRKVLPIKTWGPGLIDFHWQLPGLEYWLRKNGIPDLSPDLERRHQPKPKLSPKGDRR
jgi:hypothetical protein